MTGDEKKKRDPIFTACFVVFILAAVSVVGVYVDEQYLTEDQTTISYGDSVEVRYTGTLYALYGEDNAVVFDTNIRSVGSSDSILKSNSFSEGNYSLLDFTVGGTDVLQAFGDAVVGHKVGDRIEVAIENAYPAGSSEFTQSTTGFEIPRVQEMSIREFESLYPDADLSNGEMTTITTVYGWQATVQSIADQNKVVITNMPQLNQEYTYSPVSDDSDEETVTYGTVTFTVTSIDSTNLVCNVGISDYTTVNDDGDIQMIELDFGDETWYITNVSDGEFTYKTCDEIENTTLYFVIEIVSIN